MPEPLERVAHYELSHRLGSGGMGEVFLAHDTEVLQVVMDAGSGVTTTICKAKGGIRVTQPGSLAIDSANNHVLQSTSAGASIKELRLRGGVSPRDFGPFTAAESNVLQVVLTPVV